MSSFYIDFTGSGSAATRFAAKAEDLEQAATDGAAGGRIFPSDPTTDLDELLITPLSQGQPVVNLTDQILTATSGRLQCYGAELLALSTLVKDTVEITNEIDVEYSL